VGDKKFRDNALAGVEETGDELLESARQIPIDTFEEVTSVDALLDFGGAGAVK
jgi:hypothetical protein